MAAFIEQALAARAARSALPIATIDLATNKAVGSTRYHHIKVEHRRLEIGVTWIGTAFQRTHINTEAKLLQLWYALRRGAVQEGIFRKHMIYADGRSRDNVYFSIVDDEWPQVRARLEDKLGDPVAPAFAEAPAS